MAWASTPQVPSDDSTTRDNGLAAENDVLWSSDGSAPGDLVARVLRKDSEFLRMNSMQNYSFDEFGFGVIYWRLHLFNPFDNEREEGNGERLRWPEKAFLDKFYAFIASLATMVSQHTLAHCRPTERLSTAPSLAAECSTE